MNKGNSVITVIVAVALALVVALGVSFLGPTHKGEKGDKGENGLSLPGPKGEPGENGQPGQSADNSILQSVLDALVKANAVLKNIAKPKLGSVVGPDFYGPYFGVNDVVEFRSRQIMQQSTSTICSLVSPSATSTLLLGTVSFQVASTGAATIIDIARDYPVTRTGPGSAGATGGGGFATSTLLGSAGLTIPASAGYTFIASTTGNQIFGPNEFFVVKAAGLAASTNIQANPTGYVPVGTCNAVWVTTERLNR